MPAPIVNSFAEKSTAFSESTQMLDKAHTMWYNYRYLKTPTEGKHEKDLAVDAYNICLGLLLVQRLGGYS